jgi:group I intron endonuclease
MLIYLITNLLNNKQYIGQTTQSLEKRWQRHCWKSTSKNSMPICHAISKYGKENFKIEILIPCASQEEILGHHMVIICELAKE